MEGKGLWQRQFSKNAGRTLLYSLGARSLVYYKAIFTRRSGLVRTCCFPATTRGLLGRRKLELRLTLLWLESRELNAKLINPKECLDFLARCCGGGLAEAGGRSRRAAKHSDPRGKHPRGCRATPTCVVPSRSVHTRSRVYTYT